MSQTIEVVLTITTPDDADPKRAGEALFDWASRLDDEDADDLIESVDDWKVIQ